MDDRINLILTNETFKKCLMKNVEYEQDRIFCRHNLQHFLDVARIAYIRALELKCSIPKEIIYSAALLHDIGKFEQYESGVPHEKSSAAIAVGILKETGFNDDEIELIVNAILNHRKPIDSDKADLNSLLYEADKLSRPCYNCEAEKYCNWDEQKKNTTVRY